MAFLDTVRGWGNSGDITDYQLYLQTFDLVARGDRDSLNRENLDANYRAGFISQPAYLMLLDWKQGGEGALPEPTPSPGPAREPMPPAGAGLGPRDEPAAPSIMEGLGGTLPLLILAVVLLWSFKKKG
jgi:hypothetical protein